MKEADYMINRDKLAEELLLINREHTFRSGFRTTGKIARFFLSPAAARVLPKWLQTHFSTASSTIELSSHPVQNNQATDSADLQNETDPIPVDADHQNENPANADQSSISPPIDPDRHFWETMVPTSLARLSETPYYDHIYLACGKSFGRALFEEENTYVDTFALFKEAGVILTRARELKYYTLTQGEP
jgi:hypothetical protein